MIQIIVYSSGKYLEAIQYCDQAISLGLSLPIAYEIKGRALKMEKFIFFLDKLGQHRYAIECYDHSLFLDPYRGEIYQQKGFSLTGYNQMKTIFQYQNNYLEALYCLEQAVELNVNTDLVYMNIGVILFDTETSIRGIQTWQNQ